MERKPKTTNFGAHPLTPAPATTKALNARVKKASNENKPLLTKESSHAPDRRLGGKRTAPRCVIRLVKWVEFKPRRGTRSTELNRSNWSSDDLKGKDVADRTVAVALSWCAPL